jgi:hypothetical protein
LRDTASGWSVLAGPLPEQTSRLITDKQSRIGLAGKWTPSLPAAPFFLGWAGYYT